MKKSTQSFLSVSFGVMFEYFDMMVFSLLATSIVSYFMPSMSTELKLLYAYFSFAIAYVFRPLGAMLFGMLGDIKGRKYALTGSVALMSISTLGLALAPGANTLGSLSLLLFMMCRIGQGVAIGGEYGSAMTYAYEFSKSDRTLFSAIIIACSHVGGVLANVLVLVLYEQYQKIFFTAAILGFVLLFFRGMINETYAPKRVKKKAVVKSMFENKKAIVQAFIISATLVLTFYGGLIYVNEYAVLHLAIARKTLYMVNLGTLSLWVVLPLIFAKIQKHFGIYYKKMMLVGLIGIFLAAPFVGVALSLAYYPLVVVAQIILQSFHMMYSIGTPTFLGELYPQKCRNTAVSASYAIGASFTAALAPLICHLCISYFNSPLAIAIPFMCLSLLASFVLSQSLFKANFSNNILPRTGEIL